MKKALFAIMLTLWLATQAYAQTEAPSREIGFSTQIILNNIFNSTNAPAELIFKKQKSEAKWIRYGLTLDAFHAEHNIVDYGEESTTNLLSISPSIGIEHRKPLSNKWNIMYGGNVYASYFRRKAISLQESNNPNSYERANLVQDLNLGIRPFLGVIFNVTPRLYVSTEASANLSAGLGNRKTEEIQGGITTNTSASTRNYSIGLSPASAIFLYYRF